MTRGPGTRVETWCGRRVYRPGLGRRRGPLPTRRLKTTRRTKQKRFPTAVEKRFMHNLFWENYPNALTFLLNREICREALRQWMTRFVAALSSTEEACFKASSACPLSPLSTALFTDFNAFFTRVFTARFRSCRSRLCLCRFRAERWFATTTPPHISQFGKHSALSTRHGQCQTLRDIPRRRNKSTYTEFKAPVKGRPASSALIFPSSHTNHTLPIATHTPGKQSRDILHLEFAEIRQKG